MATLAHKIPFPVCSLAGNWWTFVLRGVLALILAVLAVLMPASALLGLTIIFGAFSMVDGIFSLIAAFRNIRAGEKWGWLAFNGVVGIGAGIVVLIAPMMASFALSLFLWWMIAFWSSASGIAQIVTAIRLRKEIKGEFWLGLGSVVPCAGRLRNLDAPDCSRRDIPRLGLGSRVLRRDVRNCHAAPWLSLAARIEGG